MRTLKETNQTPVLSVENLDVTYVTRQGRVRAVRDVTFDIWPGDALGLVGESGCGKSTLAFAIMNHVAKNASITDGQIRFCGRDMVRKGGRDLNRIRGNEIAMVYQDPVAALNPSLKIGVQLTEVLMQHTSSSLAEARRQCLDMLERVHMPDPPAILERYRHQLSGGQLQRVVIAMALLTRPALLVLDEPTTSLDVTVEAGILDLIAELKEEFGVTILFISHNLGVISRVADRVAVMYAGEFVEQGSVRSIFRDPQHPYTAALLGCIPKIGAGPQPKALQPIKGKVPALHEMPKGCVFASRCGRARERCRQEHPDILRAAEGTLVRCFFAGSADPIELDVPDPAPGRTQEALEDRELVLVTEDLKSYYKAQESGLGGLDGKRKKGFVKAVDGVSLVAGRNATLGIVGESGCGKTTLAKCIAGLEAPNAGKLEFVGVDVARAVEQRPAELLKELQMIFQNPDSTLNPRRSVGDAIARPLQLFGTVPPAEDPVGGGASAGGRQAGRRLLRPPAPAVERRRKAARRPRPGLRRPAVSGPVRRAAVIARRIRPGRRHELAAGVSAKVRDHHGVHLPRSQRREPAVRHRRGHVSRRGLRVRPDRGPLRAALSSLYGGLAVRRAHSGSDG